MAEKPIRSEKEMTWFILFMSIFMWPIEALLTMWFLGYAHGSDERVPNFGFWTCFWLNGAVGSIIGGSVIGIRLYVENINRHLERDIW